MAAWKDSSGVNRILVADDDPRVRKLFAGKLRNAGYSVEEAKSGAEALALLRDRRFHLVVLDLDMPDMPATDGFEVLKTLRTRFPRIPVVVVSGYMQGALLEAAQWFGAAFTLEKVAAPQQLVATAHKLLGHTK